MKSENPLEQIWQTYSITEDSIKIAKRVIDSDNQDLLRDTHFVGMSREEFDSWFRKNMDDSRDFLIGSSLFCMGKFD